MITLKRLDPGSSKLARDDAVYSLVDLFRGNLSTFKDPVDPVIRVLSLSSPPHHAITSPPFLLPTFKDPVDPRLGDKGKKSRNL